jgi:hypothetical protein
VAECAVILEEQRKIVPIGSRDNFLRSTVAGVSRTIWHRIR